MQYLLLIYNDEKRWASQSKAELDATIGEYRAFGQEFAGKILGGNALQPTSTAKTVRVRGGEQLTSDGPFAETKEQLGGYYLVEASGEAEAVAIGAKIPSARDGSIEVRPIQKYS